ncbi:MAG TPA: glycoside hydrolase family 57 protein [Bacteroidales bacterium]|nr:glycoside hydrolase family 57 protein [Bacteroidales bacterium]HPT02185.1 glycoside hydrolase family 57 protein [Bacteroidales bacterium]
MRSICLYFQVHQPFRLRTYRFFDIGADHYYYDDYQNKHIVRRIAEKCYLPANEILLSLFREYGNDFRVAFSITGTSLEQFKKYTPEVIESFRKLAKTGNVEFLAETYSHSLAAFNNETEFRRQVEQHARTIGKLFGVKPVTFRNTELIYSNDIADMVYKLGYHTMLTEGARQVLGWKSPNFLYNSRNHPGLNLLLRNYQLSDDIAFRFSQKTWSEWPLTTEKYLNWLNAIDKDQKVVNIFLDYETFGEHQKAESGIFSFLKALPGTVLKSGKWNFHTPSQISELLDPVASLDVPYTISWADEERDVTAWLGNDLQDEAFETLYSVSDIMAECDDEGLLRDWNYLQGSDHFYYMCTKWFSDGAVHQYFNPYSTPYEAFINYMNVVSDFLIRVREYEEARSAGGHTVAKQKPDVARPLKEKTGKKEATSVTAVPERTAKTKPDKLTDKKAVTRRKAAR